MNKDRLYYGKTESRNTTKQIGLQGGMKIYVDKEFRDQVLDPNERLIESFYEILMDVD